MAFGWLTALKVIPWGDVIEAAPQIVKGAKRLFETTRGPKKAGASPSGAGSGSASDRIHALETGLEALRAEQAASAELIRSLAEQNARLVAAMELLRVRARVLMSSGALVAVAVAGLLVWALTR